MIFEDTFSWVKHPTPPLFLISPFFCFDLSEWCRTKPGGVNSEISKFLLSSWRNLLKNLVNIKSTQIIIKNRFMYRLKHEGFYPANIKRCPNVALMLGQRHRRLTNIKPTSVKCRLFAGITADTRRWVNVGLVLLRCWTNVKPTLIQRLVSAVGVPLGVPSWLEIHQWYA